VLDGAVDNGFDFHHGCEVPCLGIVPVCG
jgi:hypothetical protein